MKCIYCGNELEKVDGFVSGFYACRCDDGVMDWSLLMDIQLLKSDLMKGKIILKD
jgi:hypothetical protein